MKRILLLALLLGGCVTINNPVINSTATVEATANVHGHADVVVTVSDPPPVTIIYQVAPTPVPTATPTLAATPVPTPTPEPIPTPDPCIAVWAKLKADTKEVSTRYIAKQRELTRVIRERDNLTDQEYEARMSALIEEEAREMDALHIPVINQCGRITPN